MSFEANAERVLTLVSLIARYIIVPMSKKTLRLLKNVCWAFAALIVFFLILNNPENNPLNITLFLCIILGIAFDTLESRK